ncbi:hypothetical protein FSS13T_10020 [Flavobacterium saliperosum S13]|uniref:Uncharacterized protein n=1 Tax=Flavobacterium saliperosum S13 TaxID=1341155 RepID=A0ABN0QI83_9FLAO|nr:hypothetical protein FSS13T_10020 [Flavobacterium saliperosum S13]
MPIFKISIWYFIVLCHFNYFLFAVSKSNFSNIFELNRSSALSKWIMFF